MYRKFYLMIIMLAGGAIAGNAQKKAVTPKLEDLPRVPMDTLATADDNIKVITYTNNTWGYYYPNLRERLEKDIFRQHWDTTQVFAYKSIMLKDLPQTVELELVKDLGDYHAPMVGTIRSKYGPRGRRNHNGVDIPLKTGEPIYATFSGKVRYARFNAGGFGNLVILRHENGLETWYAHLTRCNVKVNDYVPAGAVIGFGGNTGRSRGPHLHFEMRYCDQTFDPEHIIDFATGDLRYQTFELQKSYFNIHSRASETLDEDDDFDSTVLASDTDGLTSEEILANIAAAEKEKIAAATTPVYHTIKRGDTLSKIARQYGTSINNLCKLNNITPNSIIREGKRLRVR